MTSTLGTGVAVPLATNHLGLGILAVSLRRASSQLRVGALLLIRAIHGVTQSGL